jgi:hypothetical protein
MFDDYDPTSLYPEDVEALLATLDRLAPTLDRTGPDALGCES